MTDFARDAHHVRTSAGSGWGWTLGYGLVSILVGILAFSAPFPATLAATIVIGFFFLAGGVASLVAGFSSRTSHRGYAIFLGVLSVVAGGYMVLVPVGGALSLTLMAILWLGVRGVAELLVGIRFKRLRVPMLLLGALNLLLAIVIYTTVPWSALTLPGYILGASFLFAGIVAVMNAITERRGA